MRRLGPLGVPVLALACLAIPAVADEAELERATTEVAEALEDQRYPWYDANTDGPDYEAIREELERRRPKSNQTPWVAKMLNILAIAALLGIVFYVLLKLAESRAKKVPRIVPARAEREIEAPGSLLDASSAPDPVAWLRRAKDAAGKGDYDRAIVFLFNHQLVLLDRASAIHLEPGRTNSHYLGQVGEGVGSSEFRSSIRTFESVFYGGRPADQGLFEEFERGHDRLVQTVQRRPGGEAEPT